MSPSPKAAIIISCLVATFVAGGVAGGFVGANYEAKSRPPPRFKPEEWSKTMLARWTSELDLNSEQQEAFRSILKEHFAKVDAAHRKMEGEVHECFHRMDEKLMEHLTADQKTKFLAIKAKWHQGPPRPREGSTNSPARDGDRRP